jgi:probable rRNA maturation factor
MTTQNNSGTAAVRQRGQASLDVDLVCDAGDWTALGDAGAIVQAAADAVAAWPGLVNQTSTASVALSSDTEVGALNAQFRGKAKPTNVLSFPAGAGAPEDFLGDIILAAETVWREADEQGTPFTHHVQHLIVHGMLHLLGFDHEKAADAERMEALEIGILAKLGIANPYTDDLDTATKE